MGSRANPTMIGAFIVGAVALIVIGLLTFGRGQFFSETRTFVLYFDGSVKGLNVGAPVEFQGVRVGSVTAIKVQVPSPRPMSFGRRCTSNLSSVKSARPTSRRVGKSVCNTFSLSSIEV